MKMHASVNHFVVIYNPFRDILFTIITKTNLDKNEWEWKQVIRRK